MKAYSLKEAWDYLDNEFGQISNVYDAYVTKQDWMTSIDQIEYVNNISRDLLEIERVCGITALIEERELLYNKLDILTLPVLGYKYSIPAEIENEVKLKVRETKKELSIIQEHIDHLLNCVEVDPEILSPKN